jgi:Fur family ferric uptake transcriptional regulator
MNAAMSRAKRTQPVSDVEGIKELLRAAGLRATGPRIAVLVALQKLGRAVTHAEVADALFDRGIDRATVYRNLVDLTEVGLLRRSDVGDHVWRFELTRGESKEERTAHPHFVCSACGTVACLPPMEIRMPRGVPAAVRKGSAEVQFRGVCDACTA